LLPTGRLLQPAPAAAPAALKRLRHHLLVQLLALPWLLLRLHLLLLLVMMCLLLLQPL
jgi:hypothetical protein